MHIDFDVAEATNFANFFSLSLVLITFGLNFKTFRLNLKFWRNLEIQDGGSKMSAIY